MLNVLGSFQAYVGLCGNYAEDTIYIVDGLTSPLLSRSMLKELGHVHKETKSSQLKTLITPTSFIPIRTATVAEEALIRKKKHIHKTHPREHQSKPRQPRHFENWSRQLCVLQHH
jgi:hypothetical protein